VIHCQGQARYGSHFSPEKLDIRQLRAQMHKGHLDPDRVYQTFKKIGLNYGPAHQGIAGMELGDKELLAELFLPESVTDYQDTFVLHPSLMDSALQATIGLNSDLNDISEHIALPYALESVLILADCTQHMYAWVRYCRRTESQKVTRFDIDLCDPTGNVCVQIRGFTTRAIQGQSDQNTQGKTVGSENSETDFIQKASVFDDDFYQRVITSVIENEISVEEAAELG